ncbi:uncharacterized protein LOC131612876 [Vicia villosa]|uniref:uncharacterized protein LOC131612876 n=1 Tax=Vicia villosa TaxID=3911 RepID=UPI00273B3BAA|nr:uncharacterized protein LOC131612876 [Vicia villosa]
MPKKTTQEQVEEDYCFECKDGGQLVICDHRNCVKVYHPRCVEKDESFFETEKSWTCGRHSCFKCNKYSKFCCLGCPNSLCKHCVSASEFTVVRGVHGFCCDCLDLVEILELNLDHDLEGNKLSLDDRETYECLFKEYWEIVKVREGLTKEDVLIALLRNRRQKDFVPSKSRNEGDEEKQNDTGSNEDCTSSMHKPNKRKRELETEDEKDEKLCFVCKEGGGELVICDHKNCGKSYHTNCVGKDDSFCVTAKSWTCGRHCCFNCKKGAKFRCLGCPKSVCKRCFSAWEFTEVRGGQGLCGDCLEIVEIIEQKLDCDSKGNKISLDDKGTYECLFKEYWKNVKVRERLTDEDISAALPNRRKGKDFETRCSQSEEGKPNDIDSDEDHTAMHKENKWKRNGSMEFVGWASRPLANFLASIGRYDTEVPMLQWGVKSLICKYIKEKNLYHSKDKRKFFTDDKLFPIFDKKVMSIDQINLLLEFHYAKKSDGSNGKENHDQNKNFSTDKSHIDDQTCMESRLSRLTEKPLIKKADFLIKPGRYAPINVDNIRLIYLKRSLVLELSKQRESFASKVVGAFVRARSDSNDHKQRSSYHLVRVIGVEHAETSNEILLQVFFMPKAVSISELSDEDFTEQECEDLRQKVNTGLIQKLTTEDLQKKATSLHEDMTKHRLAYLQKQIECANLRGRIKEKMALLEEKEELEQRWKHEQLSRRVPIVPELMEVREGLTDEDVNATLSNIRIHEDEEEKQNDTNIHKDCPGMDKPSKRKRCSSIEPEPNEEAEDEELCFICKDGGQLVICDLKSCRKVYHPDCLDKDDSFVETAKSWTCPRHCCYNCNKPAECCCLGCPNSVCKKCVSPSEFTLIRGVQGLCCDCLEIVEIIELKLDCDSEGNKISLDDKETYECLFKEYWEIVKVREGLTDEDVSATLANNRKQKDFVPDKSRNEGEEEKQNETKCNEDCTSMHKLKKRKRCSPLEFTGWASRPLTNFLESIGRYETEPMTQSGVKSLICEYIKEKNLYHPKNKRKFRTDDKLSPIFTKKVMSNDKIYSRLEIHIAKKPDDSSRKENHDQNKNCSTSNKNINDHSCMESRSSSLIEKPLQKKVDTLIKPSCFASINVSNIALIYLKRSLVLELSKQCEGFVSMVVGTFVRVRSDSNDHKQGNSYQLVRILGVIYDEMPNGILLEVSFMPKAISISELSEEDFTEHECEDLRQNVNTGLLPKLTVKDLQEKATILQEDKSKRWIANRLVHLEHQIDHANLRGRTKEKIALLEEREELERRRKQEQLSRGVPFVVPELTKESDDFVSHTDEDVSAELPNKRICKDIVSLPDDSAEKENHDQETNFSTNKNHIDDQTSIKNRLSRLMEKPLMKKCDVLIKPGCLASINAKNIELIYLKRSLVQLLSKQSESFPSKVVGTFVRVKVDSNDQKLRNAYHLVRIIDVVHDEIYNGILLQVSFMPKAISITELSDEDFTKEECEDLRQKVNTGLLPKLTVGDFQEKATRLHEDKTKHWIAARLANLNSQIERLSLKGRNKQKIALLDEREELEQPWKQEQLLKRVPTVVPEFMEVKYDDADSKEHN